MFSVALVHYDNSHDDEIRCKKWPPPFSRRVYKHYHPWQTKMLCFLCTFML